MTALDLGQLIFVCIMLCTTTACGSSGGPSDSGVVSVGGSGEEGGDDDGGDDDGGDDDDGPDLGSSPLNIVSDAEHDAFLQILDQDFRNMIAASVEGGATPYDDLSPTMGTVDYTGYMNITATVLNPTVGANVLGNATLTADFVGNTLSGTATDFHEAISTFNGESIPLTVVRYDGQLDLTNGVIGGTSGNVSAFTLDLSGSLDDGVKTLVVSGQIDGSFYDADANGLRAYAGVSSGGSVSVTIDGAAAVAGATISAVAD